MLVRKHLLQFNDLILSLNMSYLNVLSTSHPLNLHLIVVKVFVCRSDPRSYVSGAYAGCVAQGKVVKSVATETSS